MVLDTIAHAGRYTSLHPAFARAFDFLGRRDLTTLPPGRHEIDGDRLYVSIDHTQGRGRTGARLEAHLFFPDDAHAPLVTKLRRSATLLLVALRRSFVTAEVRGEADLAP